MATPVREVSERIAGVADKPAYQWEVHVLDDDSTLNAFALIHGDAQTAERALASLREVLIETRRTRSAGGSG